MNENEYEYPSLDDYEIGEGIQAFIQDAKNNKGIWKDAEIINIKTIFPQGKERFTPYKWITIETMRWYFKGTSSDEDIENPDNYYEKENTEACSSSNEMRRIKR